MKLKKYTCSFAVVLGIVGAGLVWGSSLSAQAQGLGPFQVLKTFGNPVQSGTVPSAALIVGTNGLLYGTTSAGGTSGAGTIFQMNLDGTGYTVLHSMVSATEGQSPSALVQASDGKLYGSTMTGGTNGGGTLFRINPDGSNLTILRSLTKSTDGGQPSVLIQATDGRLYGTASSGGANLGGTIFGMNLDGSSFLVLRALAFANDGGSPQGLIQGADGSLYGTTGNGGLNGAGTIFSTGVNGSNFKVLKNVDFNGVQSVIQGQDGKLYGTTDEGGTISDSGTIFQLSTNGVYTVLWNMDFTVASEPFSALIQGADGTLYGAGYNTIYQIKPDGTGFTVLHALDNNTQGSQISAPLLLANNGALYGTASAGGTNSLGTIFTLPVVVPTPVLSISRAGTQVTFSWPSFATGFILETSSVVPNLSTWTQFPGPYQTVGATFTATTNTTSAAVGFFRLRK